MSFKRRSENMSMRNYQVLSQEMSCRQQVPSNGSLVLRSQLY